MRESAFALHCGLQPVGISVHVQNMGSESQPVNKSGNHRGVLKQLCPFGKRKICRHNGAAFFAPVGDNLKQQLRLVPVKAEVT